MSIKQTIKNWSRVFHMFFNKKICAGDWERVIQPWYSWGRSQHLGIVVWIGCELLWAWWGLVMLRLYIYRINILRFYLTHICFQGRLFLLNQYQVNMYYSTPKVGSQSDRSSSSNTDKVSTNPLVGVIGDWICTKVCVIFNIYSLCVIK